MNASPRTPVTVLFALPAALLLAEACGPSDGLTPTRASELIRDSPRFKSPGFEWVFPGIDFQSADFGDVGNWGLVGTLIATGHLERQGDQIVVTPKGEAASKDMPRDPQRENARAFLLARRELVEVTGIVEAPAAGPGAREVRFTWRWVPTPLGSELVKGTKFAAKYAPDAKRQGSALVRAHEQGWRVEEIKDI
jgi:hypothetical protein